MTVIAFSKVLPVKSLDANTTVLDISGQYYSVCEPRDKTWARMLKRTLNNRRVKNSLETQKLVVSDMYSSGFAAIELVPVDQQATSWKWVDFFKVDASFSAGKTTYSSINEALAVALAWHQEAPQNREVIINEVAHRALVKEDASPLSSINQRVQQWRDTGSSPGKRSVTQSVPSPSMGAVRDLGQVESIFESLLNEFPGRLFRGFPHLEGESTYFYIGTGEKGEKYTLRCLQRRGQAEWTDFHWQQNLEHLGANPEAAIRKALKLTGGSPLYFQPFILQPGIRGPRPTLPAVPPENKMITFGQHRGKTFGQLLDIDRGYLEWLARSAQKEDVRAIARSLVGDPADVIEKVIDWSQYTLNFGKQRGKTLGELLLLDPNYLYWLAKSADEKKLREGAASLIGPADVPFAAVDAEAVLEQAHLTVARDGAEWVVKGNTYPIRHLLQFLGGYYDYDSKDYRFEESPLEKLVLSIVNINTLNTVDREKIDPDGAAARHRARQAREDFDKQIDCRLSDKAYAKKVSSETVALLQRGAKFGMPASVIEEQIIDAGKIVDAFERNEPLFILASEAGSGKTFVLGAAAREILLRSGDTRFSYVTLRKGLVKQIENDLRDYGILHAFDFFTYNAIGKSTPAIDGNTIAIFDEAHTAKNLSSNAGGSAAAIVAASRLGIYASATPYEDPSEMAYLSASGIFEPHGFEAFAMAYGATPERVVTPNGYGSTRATTRIVWRSNDDSLQAAAAGREYLLKRGIYTQRKKRLPMDIVSSQFHRVSANPEWVDLFEHVSQAYDYAVAISNEMGGNSEILRAHKRNVQKRILEASKMDAGITLAKQAAEEGKQAVLFVETKSPRLIGNVRPYSELLSEYMFWSSFPPGLRDYPPPVSINQLALAQAFEELGVHYKMPSVVDEIVSCLGRDNTGVYVGSRAFETLTVTDKSADKDLSAWKANKIPFLVATMAKGGTGLSLHPTKKNNPRIQIGINLPWKAYGVDQVSGRCARYGMLSKVSVDWVFCPDIPLERELATKVGARMAAMGAAVSGIKTNMSSRLMDWDMDLDEQVDYQGHTLIEIEPSVQPKRGMSM